LVSLSVSDLSSGMTIEYEGELCRIVDYEHSKRGRGDAFARLKLKSLENGRTFSTTFKGSANIQKAYLEKRPLRFLYAQGDTYNFMEEESYEQFQVIADKLGNKVKFLKDNLELTGLFHEGKLISIDLPTFVELEVDDTRPGVKGDTASGAEKPAQLVSGLEIQVPLFIKEGDVVKVDTRSGEYVERV